MHIYKVENIDFRNFYISMSSKCQKSINNNIYDSLVNIMLVYSTWPINVLSGNHFVKESAIIRLMLISSIKTLCFWTSSLTINYFNSICLEPFEYLWFFRKEDSWNYDNKFSAAWQ